jgi:hypothetical protein
MEGVQKQLQDMSVQRNKVRAFLKNAHQGLLSLNLADFGLLEDPLYDVPDKPTDNHVDALRLTKSKKVLKVKAGVDTIQKLLVQLNRDVITAQKAGFRHAMTKRRFIQVSAGRREELVARQLQRQVKRARKDRLSKFERPTLAALEEDSDGAADFDLPGEEPDFR